VVLKFEWDPQKAEANLAKHGVSFEEAASVFGDPLGRIADSRHSVEKERFALLGFSRQRRFVAVMFTERAEAIRLISARRAIRREWREYEEGSQ